MTGRTVMIGFLAFTVVFGVALWWFQTRAFYEETEAQSVEIAGERYAVSDWQGIDAPTSPLKLRACFTLDAVPDAPEATDPTPLVAPAWFECFDAGMITRALESGEATAYLAEEEEFQGANRLVARFSDGRAFMWRQLTPEFADQ